MNYTVHGILQARILEVVAFFFSRGSSHPRDRTQVSHIAGRSLPAESQGKPQNSESSAQTSSIRGYWTTHSTSHGMVVFITLTLSSSFLGQGKVYFSTLLSGNMTCLGQQNVSKSELCHFRREELRVTYVHHISVPWMEGSQSLCQDEASISQSPGVTKMSRTQMLTHMKRVMWVRRKKKKILRCSDWLRIEIVRYCSIIYLTLTDTQGQFSL